MVVVQRKKADFFCFSGFECIRQTSFDIALPGNPSSHSMSHLASTGDQNIQLTLVALKNFKEENKCVTINLSKSLTI